MKTNHQITKSSNHQINVRGIHLHAYHGCLPEEAVLGGEYVVNVSLTGDFSNAAESDKLTDAADYVKVYQVVKREMEIRSNLIEHVAKRISESLKKEFNIDNSSFTIHDIRVEVIKKRPPIGGDVEEVSVVFG